MFRTSFLFGVCAAVAALACSWPSSANAQAGARVTVFPSPGDKFAHPGTQVSFRGVTATRLGQVTATGTRSGARTITLRNHSDGKGVSALFDRPFTPGESVLVNTALNVRNARAGDFRFRVSQEGRPIPRAKVRELPDRASSVQLIHSRHDLRPPRVGVTRRRRGVTRGKLFVTPKIGPGQNGPMILDNRGDLVWFHRVAPGLEANGLEVQRLGGQPVLTWWEGFLNFGVGNGVGKVYDSRYREVATIRAGNGYDGLDPHEIRLTDRGTAVVAIQTLVYRDLSSIGGAKRAQVFDAIVQEIDLPTGLVLYEWHSLDHVSIKESYTKPPKRTGNLFDYFHINSIEETRDGHFVVSGRNTWGVYKIDKYSGRLHWRLGGKRSSFRMRKGTRFAWQHDARVQRSGRITIFDNGAAPNVAPHSRGIALRISRKSGARLAKNYRHSSRLLSPSQGNMQRLPNGNVLIGWGQNPVWSEYSPRGRELYSARLSKGNMSYRAYRFPWAGSPARAPDIAASTDGRTTKVYASWNGGTGVTRWVVLAGDQPGALAPAGSVRRDGFETLARVGGARRFVAVRAMTSDNKVLGTSRVIAPSVQRR